LNFSPAGNTPNAERVRLKTDITFLAMKARLLDLETSSEVFPQQLTMGLIAESEQWQKDASEIEHEGKRKECFLGTNRVAKTWESK
jgi:hypothetical protein